MATLQVGTVVLVQYAGEEEWHERLICASIQGNVYLVATPDYDFFTEDLSNYNADLQGVRFYLGDGVVPAGVDPAAIYGFPALPRSERSMLLAEGWQLANQEALRLGLPPIAALKPAPGLGIRRPADVSPLPGSGAETPVLPPVAGAILPLGGALAEEAVIRKSPDAPGAVIAGDADRALPSDVQVLGAFSAAPEGMSWVALEDGPMKIPSFGQRVQIGPGHAVIHSVLGRRGLAVLASGAHITLGLVVSSAVDRFESLFRGEDARFLSIQRRGGERHRDWSNVMQDCTEEVFPDWPLTIRTSAWCGHYMTRDGGPRMHFESWKARRRLSDDDYGVDMYYVLSEILESLGCYDQADVSNLLSAEKIFRHLQLIEHYHDDRKTLDQGSGNSVPREERQAFLGGGRPASMVCPALLDVVSKELERVSNIKKNSRRLREEEADGKGKGKDKKKSNPAV